MLLLLSYSYHVLHMLIQFHFCSFMHCFPFTFAALISARSVATNSFCTFNIVDGLATTEIPKYFTCKSCCKQQDLEDTHHDSALQSWLILEVYQDRSNARPRGRFSPPDRLRAKAEKTRLLHHATDLFPWHLLPTNTLTDLPANASRVLFLATTFSRDL